MGGTKIPLLDPICSQLWILFLLSNCCSYLSIHSFIHLFPNLFIIYYHICHLVIGLNWFPPIWFIYLICLQLVARDDVWRKIYIANTASPITENLRLLASVLTWRKLWETDKMVLQVGCSLYSLMFMLLWEVFF